MSRKAVSGITLILTLIGMSTVAFDIQPGEAEHGFQLLLYTDKDTYILEEDVTIIVENIGNQTVNWAGVCPVPWDIYTYPDEKCVFEAVACYCAFQLAPGENITYVWNQSDQFTVSPVEPGMYVVRDNQGWGLSTYFKIVDAEIVVPDDYPTIQEAINAASPGETILVASGTYYEHVVVNKRVMLVGEDSLTTIIDGSGTGNVIFIDAPNVGISRFTIRNSGGSWRDSGVILCGPDSTVRYGSAINCTISGNIISDNDHGIWVSGSNNNTISNNIISDNGHGINVLGGIHNILADNVISNNRAGIYLVYSSSNILRDNNMTDNRYNFGVGGFPAFHDIDTSNTVDGKTIYYLVNQKDLVIEPFTFPNAGYLGVVNSINITVKNLNLRNNGQGILFVDTTDSAIENVNMTKNAVGIQISSSERNTISNSTLSKNLSGFSLDYSSDNTFSGNDVSNNFVGVWLEESSHNTFYHNNFINNYWKQVYFWRYLYENTWDNGEEGNYWSDYPGVDLYWGAYQNETGSDGIGDIPYVIDENNTDNYPLMSPYQYWSNPILGDINRDMKVDYKDLFTLAIAYGSTPEKPNWNPNTDINNDGRVNHKDLFILAANYGKEWKYP